MPFQKRPIHYLGLKEINDWTFKCYTITTENKAVSVDQISIVLSMIPNWLKGTELVEMKNYKVGVLIIHEGKEGTFGIVCWWVDENMLQLFAYLAKGNDAKNFELISDKGIVSCVWELEVIWFERNAWVKEVMMQNDHSESITNYLSKNFSNE